MQDISINIENLAENGEFGEDLESRKVHDEAHGTSSPNIKYHFFQDHSSRLKIQNCLNKLENTVSRHQGHDFKAYYKALPKHIVTIRSRLKWASVHYGIGKKKWMEMMKSRDELEKKLACPKNLETKSASDNDEIIKMSMEQNALNVKLEQLRNKLRPLETAIKDGNSALYCAIDAYEELEALSAQFKCNVVELQKSVMLFRQEFEENGYDKDINNNIA